jgi:hypothetical protein
LGEVSPKLSPDECAAALLKGNRNKNRNKDIYPGILNQTSTANFEKKLIISFPYCAD